MSDPTPPRAHPATPFPPPPPSTRKPMGGCAKGALFGCGGFILLLVLLGVAIALFYRPDTESTHLDAARVGLETDEEGCVEAARTRTGGESAISAALSQQTWLRSCLDFAAESPGFCEDVPGPTAIRRTVTWTTERCGDDAACRAAAPAIQLYCAEGRPSLTAADTLGWAEWRDAEEAP